MKININIDSSGAEAKMQRLQSNIEKSILSSLRGLAITLREELRPRVPKDTGLARTAVFSRIDERNAPDRLTLLLGGDVSIAPYWLYIEKPRIGGGPLFMFQKERGSHIRREVILAVRAGVKAAEAGRNV